MPAANRVSGYAWSNSVPAVTSPPPTEGPLTFEELQLAARNRGMPLEALRYDITPTGLHYLLVHFDIPAIDPEQVAIAACLEISGTRSR